MKWASVGYLHTDYTECLAGLHCLVMQNFDGQGIFINKVFQDL